jgi:hypothetical protein
VSEVGRRWIVANVVAGIASVVAGFLDYAARIGLEAGGAETPLTVTAIYAAVSAVLYAGSLAIYAWFTGAVLRVIAPAMQLRQWMALHLTVGAVAGIGAALIYTAPTGEPDKWSDAAFLDWMLLALRFVAVCTLVGAVVGVFQAHVLRRAAEGTRSLIVISALSTAVVALLKIPSHVLNSTDGTFAREAADQGTNFVAFVASAFVMLLALHRLRPRTA